MRIMRLIWLPLSIIVLVFVITITVRVVEKPKPIALPAGKQVSFVLTDTSQSLTQLDFQSVSAITWFDASCLPSCTTITQVAALKIRYPQLKVVLVALSPVSQQQYLDFTVIKPQRRQIEHLARQLGSWVEFMPKLLYSKKIFIFSQQRLQLVVDAQLDPNQVNLSQYRTL